MLWECVCLTLLVFRAIHEKWGLNFGGIICDLASSAGEEYSPQAAGVHQIWGCTLDPSPTVVD